MVEAAIEITAPIAAHRPDTIRLERTLDAPVEKVWRYLTEADLRREWFMGGTDARADGEFELLIDHDNLSADDVPLLRELCTVQRARPGRKGASDSSRPGCSRRRSRAARTAP